MNDNRSAKKFAVCFVLKTISSMSFFWFAMNNVCKILDKIMNRNGSEGLSFILILPNLIHGPIKLVRSNSR
jgi:D-alanyl-lipoteichoic acid acyltransferase DltB (MBOAT superfamily)